MKLLFLHFFIAHSQNGVAYEQCDGANRQYTQASAQRKNFLTGEDLIKPNKKGDQHTHAYQQTANTIVDGNAPIDALRCFAFHRLFKMFQSYDFLWFQETPLATGKIFLVETSINNAIKLHYFIA
jgi:hypothetical protein